MIQQPYWMQAVIYSVKSCAAALLALWISLLVGLPMPFWAMSTAYIIANPLSGATRSKAIYRVLGTALGAGAAVFMVPALVNEPALLSLALSLWVGGCLAVSLLDRSPRSYVLMLAGYTATIIGFPSVDHPEAIFDTAAARVTEITLGIVCATVVHSLILPRPVSSALAPMLHRWLADAERWLADAMAPDDARDARIAQDRQRMAIDIVDCTLMATHVPFDTSHWRESGGKVQGLLKRMLLLLPLLAGLSDRRAAMDAQGAACLTDAVSATRHWLDAGARPADVPHVLPDAASPPGRDWQAMLAESFLVRLGHATSLLAECRQLLAFLEDPRQPLAPELGDSGGAVRLHADPYRAMMSGLATSFAIMLCCVVWIYTGWADGAAAAALTGVFCCFFAAMDNPVPSILKFGGAMVGVIPLAGLYLFAILPMIDGFTQLVLVLAPFLIFLGYWLSHPRHGGTTVAAMLGFCSSLALQENYSADFAHFLNSNLAIVVAVMAAAGSTALFNTMATETAIARLVTALHRDLARLAAATTPPGLDSTLSRATDQLALLTQRLGATPDRAPSAATLGFREVRLTLNIVVLQHWRAAANPPLAQALTALLHNASVWFARSRVSSDTPPANLLADIDAVLAQLPAGQAEMGLHRRDLLTRTLAHDPPSARAALVAFRRNLFPDAPAPSLPPPSRPDAAA